MKNNTDLLKQFEVNRAILTDIKIKYKLTKLLVEVLISCYLLQTKDKPFFYITDLTKVLKGINEGRVYSSIYTLSSLSLVECSFTHRSRYKANVYNITGGGLNVLQSYCSQVNYRLGRTQHKPIF